MSKHYNNRHIRKSGSLGSFALAVALTSMAVSMSADAKNNNSTGVITLQVNEACEIVIESTKEISNIIFDLGTDSEFKLEDIASNQYVIGDYMDGIPYDFINVKAGNNGVRGVGEALVLSIPDAPQCDVVMPPVVTYMIGDIGPRGGIVIDVNADGTSGYEVAPTDVVLPSGQSKFDWGCSGTVLFNGATDLGNGEVNTDAILAETCNTSAFNFTTTAATAVAANYVWPDLMNGGSLPNLAEMQAIYAYDLATGSVGLFSIDNTSYWTSSEVDANSASSLRIDTLVGPRSKGSLLQVRAISYF